jgi:DNA-binding MarR family transcriptional regulator
MRIWMTVKRKDSHMELGDRIQQVLRFERFYAPRLRAAVRAAVINDINIVELGILHELLQGPGTPVWLAWRLDTDAGYLSRTLRKLEDIGLISSRRSPRDGRMREVSLTDRGEATARDLEQFDQARVRSSLESLPRRQQERLVRAMGVIVQVFGRDELTNLLECLDEA